MDETNEPSAGLDAVPNDPMFSEEVESPNRLEDKGDGPDTCRICRGEGTAEEPLFHPCKCSGSIKYVHQECLMEWLSRSQKRHCYLCKTSFRFTKLYHPTMPPSLPFSVFLGRAALHTGRNLILWCRGLFVITVWLIWLPWTVRFVWWGLFWIADGGWARDMRRGGFGPDSPERHIMELQRNLSRALGLHAPEFESNLARAYHRRTQPQDISRTLDFYQGFERALSFATTQRRRSLFAPLISWIDRPVAIAANLTKSAYSSSRHLVFRTAQLMPFLGQKLNSTFHPGSTESIQIVNQSTPATSHLFDLKNFDHLTPYPTLNKFLWDLFVGQCVTLSIVVGCILVFLIREWVVQQQPVINLGVQPGEVRGAQARAPNRPVPEPEQAEPARNNVNLDAAENETHGTNATRGDVLRGAAPDDTVPTNRVLAGTPGENETARPPMPARVESSRVVDIQRDLQEGQERGREPDGESPVPREDNAINSEGSIESWETIPAVGATGELEGPHVPTNASPEASNETAIGSSSQQQSQQELVQPALDTQETHEIDQEAAQNAAHPGEGEAAGVQPADQIPEAPRTLMDRMLDFVWGDVVPPRAAEDLGGNEERIVENIDEEMPFIPFVDAQPDDRPNDNAVEGPQDAEVMAAAQEAGLNPNEVDAAEDLEDLEGLLELIGMQGPLMGLIQNGIFSAVLITATIVTALWIPYLWGKVVLLFIASPVQLAVGLPLQVISGTMNFLIDFFVFIGSRCVYWFSLGLWMMSYPAYSLLSISPSFITSMNISKTAHRIGEEAAIRIAHMFMAFDKASSSDYLHLSLSAHAALQSLRNSICNTFSFLFNILVACYELGRDFSLDSLQVEAVLESLKTYGHSSIQALRTTPAIPAAFVKFLRSGNLTITFDKVTAVAPIQADFCEWTIPDRFVAVTAGYAFFAALGALYLRSGIAIATTQQGKKIETVVTEILQQAGGILKVILIISIEMLAFPFYCGVLLDLATLPLFPSATIESRINYAIGSPYTATFIHWFVGTCYMFHLALFVSMCRKILRSGVLYFIRDPDDPTFHPVRDVLERNVTSQLKKIAHSALVYGGLVIMCMGTVVWSIAYSMPGILPIRWMHNRSNPGFPIDLFMYSVLMPFIVRSIKPSKGLHSVYEWWFRKCARALRLSHFMFGDANEDERGDGRITNGVPSSGRFVRAPASDQVRIAKGSKVFLAVDADNKPLDGQSDHEDGLHGRDNSNFSMIYIPPYFRLRIGCFVALLWALTAFCGIFSTIVPVVIGRILISMASSPVKPTNDIYTFALGSFILLGTAYGLSWLRRSVKLGNFPYLVDQNSINKATTMAVNLLTQVFRIFYTYSTLLVIIPTSFSLLLEFYIVVPLNTYFSPNLPYHAFHILQDWALGTLYLRIAFRLIQLYPNARPSRAARAIIADGWLNPNAVLATRSLILPISVMMGAALCIPRGLGWTASKFFLHGADEELEMRVWRYAYPVVLAAAVTIWLGYTLVMAMARWKLRIRDEVYLIGERLHNFGEKRPPAAGRVHSSNARMRDAA